MTEETMETKPGNKGLVIGGIVVLLLIAAAFVAGRLLAPAEPEPDVLQLPPGMAFEGAEPSSMACGRFVGNG